ncbi:hypothetical protein TanjilG_10156 [Lupinus angustifolius]|uniref:Uncharacterized protein n=1 Tax=Lupinus angustifolius TaxID=3871 RepID=A0A1J7H2T1_LUPAN|nr:hypothetical protein TanjilG_10156 [Lupinus angustifolius]
MVCSNVDASNLQAALCHPRRGDNNGSFISFNTKKLTRKQRTLICLIDILWPNFYSFNNETVLRMTTLYLHNTHLYFFIF